ncbi:MAG: DUF4397 domain-containing protein [Marmoricola sp.]
MSAGRFWICAVGSCALFLAPIGAASAAGPAEAADGQVVVIQAAPGMSVDLSIDGKVLHRAAGLGDVLGPYRLAAGTHQVQFAPTSGDTPVTASLMVKPRSSSDVVLHFPAAPGGEPVISSYRTPLAPIGPGKARVLLAHTATVAPADVEFDQQTVFRDIANGEFAEVDVPQGSHEVALLPTGAKDAKALLGPLDLTLRPRTVTMVYAVGTPTNGSMDAITHTVALTPNGALAPRSVKTGSAGFAAHKRVVPFSTPVAGEATAPHSWLSTVFLRLLLCGLGTAPS